jgi:hypothetical protein
MSRYKRDSAIILLAQLTSWPEELAADVCFAKTLKAIEHQLGEHGYHFDVQSKAWIPGPR